MSSMPEERLDHHETVRYTKYWWGSFCSWLLVIWFLTRVSTIHNSWVEIFIKSIILVNVLSYVCVGLKLQELGLFYYAFSMNWVCSYNIYFFSFTSIYSFWDFIVHTNDLFFITHSSLQILAFLMFSPLLLAQLVKVKDDIVTLFTISISLTFLMLVKTISNYVILCKRKKWTNASSGTEDL